MFGAPRHLALAGVGARGVEWPIPFSLEPLLARRGQNVVALVSGDPFWFGAGASIAWVLPREEYRVLSAPSCFSLAAAHLGWSLEDVTCLGLHARVLEEALPHLHPGARLLCLLRDGSAPAAFAGYLARHGFGESQLHVMECLGGPRERLRSATAEGFALNDVAAPVLVAVVVKGATGLARTPGRADSTFEHDGQITKAPIRALTLAALAPRPGELLWDIGAGSGSIGLEWCLAGGRALAIEPNAARCENIRANIARFGLARCCTLIEGKAPEALAGLPAPAAVFIGGGADAALLETLWSFLPRGTRIVANAVTLETEALLMQAQAEKGGDLLRIDIASMAPLGRMRGWQPARPIVQWSAIR